MQHENRERAESFGEDAPAYDRLRPSYPADLVDALLAERPTDVLDVGCGTGIAAQLFADRGCRVLGIEIDDRMAVVARDRGIEVEVGQFETWNPAGRTFDLLTAGQAWHWIDPDRGPARAADVLRHGARFGLFWNRARYADDVKARLRAVYERMHAPPDAHHFTFSDERTDLIEHTLQSFRATNAFVDLEPRVFGWETTNTRAEWVDQQRTHSHHRVMPDAEREPLLAALGDEIDAMGGVIPMTYETWLVTGRRVENVRR